MVLEKQQQTTADLRAVYALPENAEKLFELINGEIFAVDAPSPKHNFIGGSFYGYIFIFLLETPLGFAFGDSTSYEMSVADELIPDVSFISNARQPGFPLPKKFTVAPDLAIEIVSPSNKPRDILKKVQTYLKYGTRLVWVVYPDERVVDVYSPAEGDSLKMYTVNADGVITGGDVLPGFTLELSKVFPPEPEQA